MRKMTIEEKYLFETETVPNIDKFSPFLIVLGIVIYFFVKLTIIPVMAILFTFIIKASVLIYNSFFSISAKVLKKNKELEEKKKLDEIKKKLEGLK